MAAARDLSTVTIFFQCLSRRNIISRPCFLRRCRKNAVASTNSFLNGSRAMSSGTQVPPPEKKDPLPVFVQPEVQGILRQITGFNLDKIFTSRPVPMQKPQYKLLTSQQVEELQSNAIAQARKLLQMPPVMRERPHKETILQQDPNLEGYDTAKYVFTDITFNVSDRDRVVVVREPDGTLRRGSAAETDRVSQVYNPHLAQDGRAIITPQMFEGQYLEDILKKGEYEYVLDRACVQFEPDNSDYIRVTSRTYEHILTQNAFDCLRSTRHFGPMAFYYVWHKKIDHLLVDMVQRDLVSDGAELVRLFCIVHPETATAHQLKSLHTEQDLLDIVKVFCQCDCQHQGLLELAVQSYEDAKNHPSEVSNS